MNQTDRAISVQVTIPVTTYHEKRIDKTLFRITSIYKGEINFAKAVEDLTIQKILRDENVFKLYEA